MSVSRKMVPAADVRTWALANLDKVEAAAVSLLSKADRADAKKVAAAKVAATRGLLKSNKTGTSRGRHSQATRVAFQKANPRLGYGETLAESPMVEVEYAAFDSKGRNRTAKWTGTASEARALYGKPGSKGRIDKKRLTTHLVAEAVNGVADRFDTPVTV